MLSWGLVGSLDLQLPVSKSEVWVWEGARVSTRAQNLVLQSTRVQKDLSQCDAGTFAM